jgi:hypothetical protein
MGGQKTRLSKMEKQYPRIDLEKNAYFNFRLAYYRKMSKDSAIYEHVRAGLVEDAGNEFMDRVDLEKLDTENKRDV